MSHRPVLYCTSYATTAEMAAASDNWNNGDFAFSSDTFSYYTYNEIPVVGPGVIPSVEGGSWVPFNGGTPPPATTAYIEQDYPCTAVALRDAVYVRPDGIVDKADASSMATGPVIGFVSALPAPGTATVRYAGQLGGFAGLTPGVVYYLNAAPAPTGSIVSPPVDAPGYFVQRVGIAASATVLTLNVTANLTLQ